jgi:hypothetical protein
MWLPETACNAATLDALIDENLRYVILSPFQAERVRPVGAEVWRSVIDGQIDTSVPYLYRHTEDSARSLAVFFYDGHLAKAVAFDGALASSHMLVDRFERAARAEAGGIVHVATDGESYGHHFKFGDRCLAYALEVEARTRGFRVTNYGEFLEHQELRARRRSLVARLQLSRGRTRRLASALARAPAPRPESHPRRSGACLYGAGRRTFSRRLAHA